MACMGTSFVNTNHAPHRYYYCDAEWDWMGQSRDCGVVMWLLNACADIDGGHDVFVLMGVNLRKQSAAMPCTAWVSKECVIHVFGKCTPPYFYFDGSKSCRPAGPSSQMSCRSYAKVVGLGPTGSNTAVDSCYWWSSNYIWVIGNFNAGQGTYYTRGYTVCFIASIALTPYMVLPLFATRFADYAGGIRVSFI